MPVICQLKVTLDGIRPPVWRRLLMSSNIRLDQLHAVIQAAFGWDDYHLHAFEAAGQRYSDPRLLDDLECVDEADVPLMALAPLPGKRFTYTYDFGDDWRHTIVVEKLLDTEPGLSYPQCIAGRRACPPEDCGGPWGYAELLAALADPAHEQHVELSQWVGGSFDDAAFDLDQINADLAKLR